MEAEKVLTFKEIQERTGFEESELAEILGSIGRELKQYNKDNIQNIGQLLAENDEFFLEEYFRNPIVDMGLLLQDKFDVVNNLKSTKTPIYQAYLNLWRKYRGY